MLNALFRLSLYLAATRLVAITMPIADFIVLAHAAPDRLASYALGAQSAQIGIVACGALGVGIAIVLPRCTPSRQWSWLPAVAHTALGWGSATALLTLALALLPAARGTSAQVTAILAAGMVPLSIYASLAAYGQSVGRSRLILAFTALAGILNLALDAVLIDVFDPAIGVACATVLSWSILAILIACRSRDRKVERVTASRRSAWPRRRAPWKAIRLTKHKALYRIALPDFLSKVGFVGAVALAFWWLSGALDNLDFRDLAITLNYMNVVFVVVSAVATAFGITFLNAGASQEVRAFSSFSGAALLLLLTTFVAVSPGASYLYFADICARYLQALALGTIVVIVDGVALFALTLFRMQGAVALPPYLRLLMFPVASVYMVLAGEPSLYGTLWAMLFGNMAVALRACISCRWYLGSKNHMHRSSVMR